MSLLMSAADSRYATVVEVGDFVFFFTGFLRRSLKFKASNTAF